MYRGTGDVNGQIWIGNQMRNCAIQNYRSKKTPMTLGARCSGGLFGKHEQRSENAESVQCLKSNRSCLAANVGASHVGARSKRKHLPAMGLAVGP